MKITREALKNIVKETMIEENEYKVFFKKALEKAGKSIPQMSDEEKKAFFNKIEKTWKGRGTKSEGNAFGAAVAKAKKDGDKEFEVGGKKYKTERFGRGHEGPTFGEEEVDEMVKSSEIGKGDNKKPSKDASDSSQINEDIFDDNGMKKAFPWANKKELEAIYKIVYSARSGGVEGVIKKYSKDRSFKPFIKKVVNLNLGESINEGASTEEKRIAMLAVRKQAKYRNVDLATAIQDQIRALEDLKRDAKKGKLK